MRKLNRLHYLMFFLITSLIACKKENQNQVLQKEASFSVSEKVLIPFTGNTSGYRQETNDYNTFYGPEVQMGNGHARSWVNITRTDDKPLAAGIEFTANSFEGLSADPLNFAASTFILKLHQKAMALTPFDHITINWEPNGHEPEHVYDVPHFDIHFYKITVAQQMAITGIPTAPPASGYLPASYVIEGATVPQMGTHWLDPFNSPELHGVPFTHTLIYGSHTGDVIFIEPMITRAFLQSGTSFSTPYPQPIHFSPSGTYYPTAYSIWKNTDNGRSYVALTDFVWR
jgi:hypothetical protein